MHLAQIQIIKFVLATYCLSKALLVSKHIFCPEIRILSVSFALKSAISNVIGIILGLTTCLNI